MWTIGNQEEDEEEDEGEVGGAIAATRAAESRARSASFPSGAVPAPQQSATSTAAATAVHFAPPTSVQTEPSMLSPMEILTPSIETFDEAEGCDGITAVDSATNDDVVMSESEAETDVETGDGGGNHADEDERCTKSRKTGGNTVGFMDIDSMITPTVAKRPAAGKQHLQQHCNINFLLVDHAARRRSRSVTQDSDGLFNSETGSRRDTPIPADLVPTTS